MDPVKRIYLSGPITSDPDHRAHFAQAAQVVIEQGNDPINPIDIGPGCKDFSCLEHDPPAGEGKHTWSCYMKADVAAMVLCDGVVLLKGWEKSPGAQAEQFIARMLRIPVEEL